MKSEMIDPSSDISDAPHTTPGPADLVGELLQDMRLVGIKYRRIEIEPPFGLRFGTDGRRAQFHFVARGPVLLRDGAGSLQSLNAGDAVLLPHGGPHELISEAEIVSRDVDAFDASPICSSVSAIRLCPDADLSTDSALIFSGCMDFDLGSMGPLVGLMPEVMRADTLSARYPEMLPILEAMEREARGDRVGFAGILARLADVVAAFVVRAWVECGCGDARGWVTALRDPRLSRVIVAVHRDPGRNWTVAELAAEMGSSRSVFAERFLTTTGVTPVRYLTELRMRLAAQWIAAERMPIETAAHRLGYGSQAAFSRAFKRVMGHTPGDTRMRGS